MWATRTALLGFGTGFVAVFSSAAALPTDHDEMAAPSPRPAFSHRLQDAASEGAFGFAIGEERRYAIGPDDALEAGEGELWVIRLETIDGRPPSRRVRFRLEHEARHYARSPNVFSRGQLTVFRGSIDLTVNDFGFPLRVEYRSDVENAPTQYGQEEATLAFADGKFAIRNRFSMAYRQFNLTVPASPLVDPSVPKGVYVAGFENPGLYGLVLTGVDIEQAGDVEYLAVAPSRFADRGRGRGGIFRPRRPRGGDLDRTRLRFEEITKVEIGGAEMDALRLRRPCCARPDIYVQRDGTVLRVDISTDRRHTAWIRLLRPSEY